MADEVRFKRDDFSEEYFGTVETGQLFVVKRRAVGSSVPLAPVYRVTRIEGDEVVAEETRA